jgi:kynurenine formamidase
MPVIDLTMNISPQLPSFPGSPQPQFISWAKNEIDGYNLELIFISSHSGTYGYTISLRRQRSKDGSNWP